MGPNRLSRREVNQVSLTEFLTGVWIVWVVHSFVTPTSYKAVKIGRTPSVFAPIRAECA